MTAFDLDAYFKRIGYSGERSPTVQNLQLIHARHPQTIPFENLNPLLKWPVNLDMDSLQQKLIHTGRGGYCYEQNLLFRHALEAMGFHVSGLAARVSWNTEEGVVLPRTHMLLRIDLEGQTYIADVGFGGLTLTTPLRLQPDIEQQTPHEPFRLITERGEFILQAKLADVWRTLYRFTLDEHLLPDYEMANFYVSCHPKSRFVNNLSAARTAQDRRHTLFNNEFKVHHRNGGTETRLVKTVTELREVLEGPLGITLPTTPQLDQALERVVARCSGGL
jgi:N-hydroxyarylamine O-acetyltransferase